MTDLDRRIQEESANGTAEAGSSRFDGMDCAGPIRDQHTRTSVFSRKSTIAE